MEMRFPSINLSISADVLDNRWVMEGEEAFKD
jgi:hypothetical protein